MRTPTRHLVPPAFLANFCFSEAFPAVVPLLALLSPVRRRVSTPRAALCRSPPCSRALHRGCRRWGAPGVALRGADAKVFLDFLSVSGLSTEGRKNVSQMGGDGLDMWFSDETDMGAAHLHHLEMPGNPPPGSVYLQQMVCGTQAVLQQRHHVRPSPFGVEGNSNAILPPEGDLASCAAGSRQTSGPRVCGARPRWCRV